ncbi:uncharacterized protein LOC117299552 [Asterias rubens]|uniref:uncharacterized protein LOC117299552 n=1 Tax=Asterias rubens TaxID=7604 RepID=UPI001454EBEC|nr:uncharacterized protein LOC117299552 [Asterias rubens]
MTKTKLKTTSAELVSSGTFCITDTSIPKESPGNAYYCPAFNEDGTPNTFIECCNSGRIDATGHHRQCCEAGESADNEKWNTMKDTGIYIGIATGCLLIFIFVFTYCRSDTYPCVGALQRNAIHWKDTCLDAICFCDCFKSKRKIQRRLELTKMNQIEPLCDDHEHLVVPMVVLEEKRQFWW